MASYKEFRTSNAKRRRKQKMRRYATLAAVIVLILGMAYIVVRFIERGNGKDDISTSLPVTSEVDTPGVDTSLPDNSENVTPENSQYWKPEGPVQQTINFEIIVPDTRMIAVQSNGRVELSYFDTAVLVGDSLTDGWRVYKESSNPFNSPVVAYIGISPQGFTGMQKRSDGTMSVPLDEISDNHPLRIYLMLGTNSLVSMSDEAFLTYYADLIDEIQTRMPWVEIYIQSILPVRPEVTAKKPGLENNRIRAINDQLAKIAYTKGVYFLNVQEVFTDGEGNLREDVAAGDGIHLKPAGYQVWAEYMITHVAHKPGNPYLEGSPYYDGGLV